VLYTLAIHYLELDRERDFFLDLASLSLLQGFLYWKICQICPNPLGTGGGRVVIGRGYFRGKMGQNAKEKIKKRRIRDDEK
jgi:hypothetical protein